MLRRAIAKLIEGTDLESDEVTFALEAIMEGQATPAQIAGFLVAMRMKGELPHEVAAAAMAMRARAVKLDVDLPVLVDTCGTGGDGLSTFNISTVAAFVVAGAGVAVAKHGNRKVSSHAGSADLLETLGVRLDIEPRCVAAAVKEAGIGFLFAPSFHPALKHAAAVRRDLGIRTLFNMLGPLTNPAGARYQLLGVYDRGVLEVMARALGTLGSHCALVVHGSDGMDELTLTGETYAAFLQDNCVEEWTIRPADLGFEVCRPEDLATTSMEENAKIAREVLAGTERGPRRQIVCANAGAALFVAGKVRSLADGARAAERSIDSGAAQERLQRLVELTRAASRPNGGPSTG
ncbi:MAG: anthranilate phosphoribosyltransferase [Candidatus Riflebacteria bacterium]|nr:anthranilate phosphoribosyltransferase [Candidatus Riflebacteria bacterium]